MVAPGRSDGRVEAGPLPRVEVPGASAPVEPELVRGTVNDSARQNSVDWRPCRERSPEESLAGCGVGRGDERLRPWSRSQNGGVDARARGEAGSWNPPPDAELVAGSPGAAEKGRRPYGRSLRRESPLHDCVELRQGHVRVSEEAPEDRRTGGEREVRDDGGRLVRQRDHRQVRRHHLDPWVSLEALVQPVERLQIELDGTDTGSGIGESAREDATAGAESDDEHPGHDPGLTDECVR